MTSSRLFATTLLVVSTLAFAARAHRVGLSRGEYTVGPTDVTATLTFARAELASMRPDSTTAATETFDALGRAILTETHVAMGGSACRGELRGAAPVAPDGVEISLEYDCPRTGAVELDYGFVDRLDTGHRHVAQVKGGERTATFVAYRGNTTFDVDHVATDDRSLLAFFRLGVEHVLTGWDHLAFLLGVALAALGPLAGGAPHPSPAPSLRARLRTLALAVTAFTLAHSVTLAASVLGFIVASPRWVEPLIALSIAYVGLESSLGWRAPPYRTTLAFGLVHGMGFAGALREIAIPPPRLAPALALFNAGVEVGQLLALIPVVIVLGWLSRNPTLLLRTVRATGMALVALGATLTVSRGAASMRDARAARGMQAARSAGAARGSVAPADAATTGDATDAERLCRALHETPRVRRAECEHAKPGIALTASCTEKLSRSVASGAVAMSSEDAAACVAELSRRYDTCDFTKEHTPPHARACEHVLHGKREADASCRSSLECLPGLFCDGAGPLDAGVCHPPRAEGETCGLSIDPLAGYVPLARAEEHRECGGECINYRCRPARAATARR